MENNTEKGLSIFEQICTANGLDPQVIREEARQNSPEKHEGDGQADLLIRAAFRHRANELVANLNIGVDTLTEGKEYNADGDPMAPSFILNDDYIRNNYSEEEAEKIIDALGQVQLPIRA